MFTSNKAKRAIKKSLRAQHGSALAEFGPALFILLFMLFFPLVDLLGLGASYASCLVLNYCQLREAALCSKPDALNPNGAVKQGIPKAWKDAGIGQFANLAEPVRTAVDYTMAGNTINPKMQDEDVHVSTTLKANPFLTIPFFPGVPGLGAPVSFTISTERLLETCSNS